MSPAAPLRHILFVDDEPRILEGLRRMLRPQRAQWGMEFANSGAEALELLAKSPFDVIVTDMRMPEMDGARLLECVREKYPAIIRIVLSGYSELETALRAVPVAHQYLAKPCDPEKLREAIERSCSFTGLLPDEAIRRVIGTIGRLPAMPRTGALLMDALQKPDVPIEEIGRIIEQDVGITAKVLQLVNSAFFGLLREITTVRMAVSYLGFDTLRHLVMSAEIFRTFRPQTAIAGFSIEELQEHSRLTARIAARLPLPKAIASSAVVSALLHDVGKLILASRLPERLERALRESVKQKRPLHLVEAELTGIGHSEIGAYLLGLWGLPKPVVQAVCRHHQPAMPEGAPPGLDILAATHIADALAHEQTSAKAADPPPYCLWDDEYLKALGVADQLPGWREMAAQVAQVGEPGEQS